MARGYATAQKYHEENTGMGFTPFNLAKDKDSKQIRVLQTELEWVNLFIHNAWQKIKPTRCAATVSVEDDKEVEDRTTCPLCMAEVPRTLRTYIPVRVRGDENPDRVQVIVYGRDHLAQVINQIENLPEGKHMTDFDFKVTRKGDKLDTVYFWNLVADPDTQRPLNDAELSLVVPQMEEVIPILEEVQLLRRAQDFASAESAAPVESANKTKTPF